MNIIKEGSLYSKLIIGIDPGASGALVALTLGDGKLVASCSFNNDVYKSLSQQASLLQNFYLNRGFIFIEDIPLSQFRSQVPTPSIAKVYGHSQFWKGVSLAYGFPLGSHLFMVDPQTWQGYLNLIRFGSGTSYKEKKVLTKNVAKKLFPNEKISVTNADAFLIAEYGRRFMVRQIKKGLI